MSLDARRNVLTTVPAHRPGHPLRQYKDWTIDGHRLVRWLDRFSPNRVFGHDPAAGFDEVVMPTREDIAALEGGGHSPLKSGRCPLYRCPECADLGCGTLAVRVTVHAETTTWTDFARESTYATVDYLRVLAGQAPILTPASGRRRGGRS